MLPRERFAIVWIVALVTIFAIYFSVLAILKATPLSIGEQIALLAGALGSLGVVAAGTWLAQRMHRRPGDADDERDRAIEDRASSVAYRVLMVGMLLVGCVMPFGAGGWEIVHAALLAVAVAEIVHYGLIISGYRRGLSV